MSVNEIKEKVVKEVEVVKEKQIICDECKKIIRSIKSTDNLFGLKNRIEWYSVTTGHYDWGNDSEDSIEHMDICPDCIEKVFNYFMKRSKGDNTEYIHINHEYGYEYEKVGF